MAKKKGFKPPREGEVPVMINLGRTENGVPPQETAESGWGGSPEGGHARLRGVRKTHAKE